MAITDRGQPKTGGGQLRRNDGEREQRLPRILHVKEGFPRIKGKKTARGSTAKVKVKQIHTHHTIHQFGVLGFWVKGQIVWFLFICK